MSWSMRLVSGALVLGMLMGSFTSSSQACTGNPSAGEVKLTPEEVKSTFVGVPWHGPSGAFIFRESGTYSYRSFNGTEKGTWAYQILDDGTIEGGSTTYTFYRSGNRYRYFHGRSCNFFSATPNQSF